jgi:hypothetical protein
MAEGCLAEHLPWTKPGIGDFMERRFTRVMSAGITEYLRNGGKLEVAEQMANHESAPDHRPLRIAGTTRSRSMKSSGY